MSGLLVAGCICIFMNICIVESVACATRDAERVCDRDSETCQAAVFSISVKYGKLLLLRTVKRTT